MDLNRYTFLRLSSRLEPETFRKRAFLRISFLVGAIRFKSFDSLFELQQCRNQLRDECMFCNCPDKIYEYIVDLWDVEYYTSQQLKIADTYLAYRKYEFQYPDSFHFMRKLEADYLEYFKQTGDKLKQTPVHLITQLKQIWSPFHHSVEGTLHIVPTVMQATRKIEFLDFIARNSHFLATPGVFSKVKFDRLKAEYVALVQLLEMTELNMIETKNQLDCTICYEDPETYSDLREEYYELMHEVFQVSQLIGWVLDLIHEYRIRFRCATIMRLRAIKYAKKYWKLNIIWVKFPGCQHGTSIKLANAKRRCESALFSATRHAATFIENYDFVSYTIQMHPLIVESDK